MSVEKKAQRVAVIPDVHAPRHDRAAWATALSILREFRPDQVVIIGDFADLESLSHHPKNRPDVTKLAWEYHECNLLLDELQESAPSAKWYFIEGNHEYRAVKFCNQHGELDGVLNVPENLFIHPARSKRVHTDLRGIEWIPFRTHLAYAWVSPWEIGYLHSAKANKGGMGAGGLYHAAYHANNVGPASRCNITVYGHHHTFQFFRSNAGYEAWCCGFLGDMKNEAFDYNGGPSNWCNGILLQQVDGPLVTTTPVPIRNGRALL